MWHFIASRLRLIKDKGHGFDVKKAIQLRYSLSELMSKMERNLGSRYYIRGAKAFLDIISK